MKGFIASVVTLCLLVGLIIWNGIWVHRTTAELIELTEMLDGANADKRQEHADELYGKWIKCRHILAVTVSHTEIEIIDTRIVSLKSYADDGEVSDFNASLVQLKEELEFLHRSESLTIEGII